MNAKKNFVSLCFFVRIEGKSEVRKIDEEGRNESISFVKRGEVFLALDNLECTQFMDL